ncbi:hypothetical protein BpHYR1_047320 [Brachionus plicatilis]|uniref:Uncharacterized protein n=1 Tax=Brachionus plicatilis TaxID=10195 RepID=A0A3M7RP35_BRAPC|nr:hypothetical protein BpHYR1_047320 [Brachionus plicatilis]
MIIRKKCNDHDHELESIEYFLPLKNAYKSFNTELVLNLNWFLLMENEVHSRPNLPGTCQTWPSHRIRSIGSNKAD